MTYLLVPALGLLLLLCAAPSRAQSDAVVQEVPFTFTTIDVPGAGYTGVFGINGSGDMVGNYGQDTNVDSHGFLYSKGIFTFFDYPGSSETVPYGINGDGLIVGYSGDTSVIGFFYDGTRFTPIRHGNDTATFSLGINDKGVVVGGAGTTNSTKGFESRDGQFVPLKVPGQHIYVYGSGINNSGVIVGWADDGGFQCRLAHCRALNFPGAVKTEAVGINDNGVIVGWYEKGPPFAFHSFVLVNGKFRSLNYPGAKATFASGINNLGQVVGEYTDDFKAYHGFVTTSVIEEHQE